jgi:DNA-directed RNA polymerase III subunit RPC1
MQKRMRKCSNDRLRRAHLFKSIHERCKKKSLCPKCGAFNGTVKKLTGVFKIIHDRFKNARAPVKSKEAFYQQFETALTFNADLRSFVKNAVHDLNPLTVRHMFMNIPDCDLEVLDMPTGRPEDLLITSLLVPPVCIRPSVPMGPSGTNEDDLTIKIGDIIQINLKIKNVIDKHAGQTMTLMELWEFLQAQVAMLINSDMPGFPHSVHNTGKPLRALSQRLKGKQGRFRGNLSGKRVDFSARTVISPDPNLSIEEVGIPVLVAKILTVPERVTVHNLALMRQLVRNGPNVHPGANILERPDGFRVFLKYTDRKKAAAELTVGTLLERHLADGDVVLFNRQPSLHRLSIMCHRVKVRPWRTFRFNTCVCTPYNADFDGDEMNVHVPQTLEARAEALLLMGVRENLMTPKSGEPLVALNQDFLTGSFLITQRDVFFDRTQFVQLVACISDATEKVIIPAPAILKPIQLWTGKQLMSLVFRPNNGMSAYPSNKPWPLLNIELKSKNYDEKAAATCLDARDGYIVVKNSELLCGNLCKNAMGGTKGGIIFVLIRDHSAAAAVTVMNRTVKMISRWMLHRGFSVGIDDVTPSAHLIAKKKELTTLAYAKCDEKIADYHAGRLEPRSGCTAAQTVEQELLGCLKIREEIAEICLRELSYHNAPLIMAVCGSKGNKENIAQMTALLGQQAISGQRITNGFGTRTLPQFAPGSLTPAAKGFVQNSFYSGLTGTEFFFHTMGGREGLVDTAVKTAETGYMQRRLMKALEDLCAQYDKTVRNSETTVVQFTYGDDGLDPIMMEQYTLGKEKRHGPADLPRLLEHIRNTQPCVDERGLSAEQIRSVALTVQDMSRFAGTSTKFRGTVADHLNSIAKSIDEVVAGFADLDMSVKDNKKGKKTKTDNINSAADLVTERIHRLTPTQLESYLEVCKS